MKSNCTSLFLNKTCLLLSPIQPWSVYFIKHTMLEIPLGLVTYHFNTIWKAFAGKHALFITSLLKRLGRTFYKVLQSITLFDLEYQKVNSQQTWLLWRQKKERCQKKRIHSDWQQPRINWPSWRWISCLMLLSFMNQSLVSLCLYRIEKASISTGSDSTNGK